MITYMWIHDQKYLNFHTHKLKTRLPLAKLHSVQYVNCDTQSKILPDLVENLSQCLQGNTYCKAFILRNETDMNPMHMLVTADRFIMQIGWIFVLCFTFPRYSVATSKCHNLNGAAAADW
ncbi:hypothetical protein T06_10401 [Trichinella sp. T6]|nr:hypothetical protein T06_10401 [Trichinella sp. T6]